MLVSWTQTFKDVDRAPLVNAGVSVYWAGTSTAVRVFDSTDVLRTLAPQVRTDGNGKVTLSLDTDDYSSGQLFDIVCTPNSACSTQSEIRLYSLQVFNDTEGFRFFKNVTVAGSAPTEGMRDDDIWFDSSQNNEVYIYDTTNGWVSRRDGTIVAGAVTTYFQTTAPTGSSFNSGDLWFDTNDNNKCHRWNGSAWVANNYDVATWSKVTGTGKPSDYADKTGDNTANNTNHVNNSDTDSGYTHQVYGDVRMHNGSDLYLYNSGDVLRGKVYASASNLHVNATTASVVLSDHGNEKLRTTASGITVIGSCTGCDYVFEKNYKLLPLDNLQLYIAKNECLPGMTINEGMEIDLNKLRQETVEKIEELTLYTLQLHKRLKELE